MELRHLVYFEAVARHQHVSRAAEELSIAQPAISKQIQDLERELGAGPLFERVGRRLRITAAGEAFLEHVRTILAQVDTAKAEMLAWGGLAGGRVTIGAPPSVSERLLPGVLAAFHRRYPQIEIRMYEGSSQMLLGLLDRGEIDLGVVILPIVRPGLMTVPLFTERLVVAVAADHRLAHAADVSFEELQTESFLLYEAGDYMSATTIAACKAAGFDPRVTLHGGSLSMLLRLVEAGLGVAVIPQLALTDNESLVVLPIRGKPLTRTMGLVSHDTRARPPAVVAMRSFLEEHLKRA